MWLFEPSTFAAASGACLSDWPAGVEVFATSSAKALPRRFSWIGWRKRGWIRSLCGTISQPSTAARGVALWIASQRDSLVLRSRSRASSSARKTNDSCGRSFDVPLFELERRSSSWKTSGALFDIPMGSGNGSPILPASGSMRSGRLYPQAMSDLRSDESACSSWPTATSTDSKSSGAAGYSTESGRHSGTTLTDAARAWPTPNASALNEHETPESFLARAETLKAKGYNGNGASMPLGVTAKQWATHRAGVHGTPGSGSRHPTIESQWAAATAHDGRRPGLDTKSTQGANLSRDAALWATPSARDWKSDDASQSPEHSPPLGRQVLTIDVGGTNGSPPAGPLLLCPQFVEALQGFPRNWSVPTASGLLATPARQRSTKQRSSSSRVEPLGDEP